MKNINVNSHELKNYDSLGENNDDEDDEEIF